MNKKLSVFASAALAIVLLTIAPKQVSATTAIAGTITQVYSNNNTLLMKMSASMAGEGCTDNTLAVIDKTQPNWQQLFQLALAGYLSGKTVTLSISGCSYYPKVNYIWMK